MIRKVIIIFLLLVAVVAGIAITGRVRDSKRMAELADQIKLFANVRRIQSLGGPVALARKIAADHGADAVPALAVALRDAAQARAVRSGCALTLGWIDHPDADKALLETIKRGREEDWYVLSSAIHGVALRKLPEAEPDLRKFLEDRRMHPSVRQQAIVALGRLGTGDYEERFLELFRTGTPHIMKGVVAAFGSMDGSDSLVHLLDAYIERNRASGTLGKPSYRVLKDLLDMAVMKATEQDAANGPVRQRLQQILAWKWDRVEVDLNNLNFIKRLDPDTRKMQEEVWRITAPGLLASLAMACALYGPAGDGMVAVVNRALDDPPGVSPEALPDAMALFFKGLAAQGTTSAKIKRADTAAKKTIDRLVELLDDGAAAHAAVALACMRNLARKGCLGTALVEQGDAAHYKDWWSGEKDKYSVWKLNNLQ